MSWKRNVVGRQSIGQAIEALESRRLLAAVIAVDYQGVTLADGDTTPSVDEGTDFGVVPLGATPAIRTYRISNTGDQPLTVGQFTFVGSYELAAPPTLTTLNPGQTTNFSIRLLTSTSGDQAGSVSFVTNSSGQNPFDFKVTGKVADTATSPSYDVTYNGNSIPDGDTSPSLFEGTNFGSVEQGGATITRTYAITNTGLQSLNISNFRIDGAGFEFTGIASTVQLAPDTTYEFSVRLQTSATGTKNATVRFDTDGIIPNYDFAIRGIVNAQGVSDVEVRFGQTVIANADETPSTLEGTLFETAPENGTPAERVFTILNTGATPLNISNIQVSGPFEIIQQPGNVVQPGQSGTLRIRLNTGLAGTYTQPVMISTNSATTPLYYFYVSGVVEEPQTAGSIRVIYNNQDVYDNDTTPSTTDGTDFGTVGLNAELVRTFTVRNEGSTTLVMSNFTVGTGFTIVNTPLTSLPPGQSTTIRVRITTATAGDKTATLSFTTNVQSQNPYNFTIKGTVTNQSQPSAPPQMLVRSGGQTLVSGPSTVLNVGTVLRNSSASQSILVTNTGGAPLALRNISASGDFVYNGASIVTIPSGDTATLVFSMRTDTAGGKQSTVRFATNDPNAGSFTFGLSGLVRATVIPGDLVVRFRDQPIADGDTIPARDKGTIFGASSVGERGFVRYFTLTNPGPGTLTVRSITLPAGFLRAGAYPTTITSGQSFVVAIKTDTTYAGTYSGNIRIATDEPGNAEYAFAVSAVVSANPSASPAAVDVLNYLKGADDFNNDDHEDLVWQDLNSGTIQVWLMNGSQRQSTVNLPAPSGSNWQLEGVGDLSGDDKPDLVFRDTASGKVVVWTMNGTVVSDMKVAAVVANQSWSIAAVGDFNNDDRDDLIWRNSATGVNSLWLMGGVNSVSQFKGLSSTRDTAWTIGGVGDFNNDGKIDVVWRNSTTGANALWLLNGNALSSVRSIGAVAGAGWRLGAVADINDDDEPDLLWQNTQTGQNLAYIIVNGAIASTVQLPRFDA